MAEEMNVQQGTQQEENKETKSNNNANYEELDTMIAKGTEVKKNGISKSYLTQKGIADKEAEDFLAHYEIYRAEKEKAAIKEHPEYVALQKELETLKSTAQREKVNNAIQLQAMGMGLNEKAVNALLKLQAFDDVLSGDKINNDKIKANIDAFLKDYDMFKPQQGNSGFSVEIGAKDEKPKKETEEEAMLRAIGLLPKK